jgi:transcriptional regulator with XRE-family HTH domain
MANPKSGDTARNPLTTFLREKRAKVPAARDTQGRGNFRPGLSQSALANLIGVSLRHLRRIEVAEAEPTDQILGLMSEELQLTVPDRIQLWRLAVKRDPPVAYLIDSARLSPYWQWLVPLFESHTRTLGSHLVVGPAVGVVKLDSEHLAYNEEYARLFDGGHPPVNHFKWLSHEGVKQLPNHREIWLAALTPSGSACPTGVVPKRRGLAGPGAMVRSDSRSARPVESREAALLLPGRGSFSFHSTQTTGLVPSRLAYCPWTPRFQAYACSSTFSTVTWTATRFASFGARAAAADAGARSRTAKLVGITQPGAPPVAPEAPRGIRERAPSGAYTVTTSRTWVTPHPSGRVAWGSARRCSSSCSPRSPEGW